MERFFDTLDKVDIGAGPSLHRRTDALGSLGCIDSGVKCLKEVINGYGNVCTQTSYRLAFLLAHKAGVDSVGFRAMKERIIELPTDLVVLLKEIQNTRMVW